MSLRDHLHRLEQNKQLIRIDAPVSKNLEMAGILKKLEPSPVLFTNVREVPFQVAGNLFCSKQAFADYFGLPVEKTTQFLIGAIEQRKPCEIVKEAPCQDESIDPPDLDKLPLLFHCAGDGGNYISAGIFTASHPKYGQNIDFHRCMQFSKNEMSVRVVSNRHFDYFLKDRRTMDVAICIGNPPNILAAAATSVELGVNELEIANALEPVRVVKAKTSDLLIPADCEFVIEGTISLDLLHGEGPFVDLTETYDLVRQQPVMQVRAITHRRDAIWQALLPGGLEHKLLMGMPREPTIFKKVNEVVRCTDVNVNPGGCSWLHAIVQIDKQAEEEGQKAIRATFAGHSSCKHVYVVDKDIDIYDPLQVEWAMATRFQGDRDLIILDKAQGSSLDPSAEAGTHLTTRMGFDLTAPLKTAGKSFTKAEFPTVELEKYLDDKEAAEKPK